MASSGIDFPPGGTNTSGAIVPAQRFRAEQPATTSVSAPGQSQSAQGTAGNIGDARSSDARASDSLRTDGRADSLSSDRVNARQDGRADGMSDGRVNAMQDGRRRLSNDRVNASRMAGRWSSTARQREAGWPGRWHERRSRQRQAGWPCRRSSNDRINARQDGRADGLSDGRSARQDGRADGLSNDRINAMAGRPGRRFAATVASTPCRMAADAGPTPIDGRTAMAVSPTIDAPSMAVPMTAAATT